MGIRVGNSIFLDARVKRDKSQRKLQHHNRIMAGAVTARVAELEFALSALPPEAGTISREDAAHNAEVWHAAEAGPAAPAAAPAAKKS